MNNPTTAELVEALRGLGLGAYPLTDRVMHIAANRLEALEEKQRWRPVTDCPKADGQYLVTCRSFGGQWTRILGFAKVGEDVDDYDLGGKRNVWYDYDSEYGYGAIHSVTHWMPLPEVPKEESE